jgi:hypothetical protein
MRWRSPLGGGRVMLWSEWKLLLLPVLRAAAVAGIQVVFDLQKNGLAQWKSVKTLLGRAARYLLF